MRRSAALLLMSADNDDYGADGTPKDAGAKGRQSQSRILPLCIVETTRCLNPRPRLQTMSRWLDLAVVKTACRKALRVIETMLLVDPNPSQMRDGIRSIRHQL